MSADRFKNPRILVTNDDGIHAPGLKVLEQIAFQLSDDVWTVAPEVEQSAASHALTLRRPLHIKRLARRRFSVDGTPTDCVVVAMNKVMKDNPPDMVLSGINHGANLAEDVAYSGTVSAAMEAAMFNVPSIALSQVHEKGKPIRFEVARKYGASVLKQLYSLDWTRDLLININFPSCPPKDVAGVKIVPQGRRDTSISIVEGKDPDGYPYVWIGDWAGEEVRNIETDLSAIAGNMISVTPLHQDLTHKHTLDKLIEAFR